MLDDWITALTRELGLDGSVDEGLLLDVARDAAHNVARPAAPVTTFLVGLAAGRAGGSGRRLLRTDHYYGDDSRQPVDDVGEQRPPADQHLQLVGATLAGAPPAGQDDGRPLLRFLFRHSGTVTPTCHGSRK